MSTAEYQRQWRKSHGQGGPVGRPATAPHGTVAAYKRHRRHSEPPCAACRKANADYHRNLYRKRKTK